jgi:hypothetical protein
MTTDITATDHRVLHAASTWEVGRKKNVDDENESKIVEKGGSIKWS